MGAELPFGGQLKIYSGLAFSSSAPILAEMMSTLLASTKMSVTDNSEEVRFKGSGARYSGCGVRLASISSMPLRATFGSQSSKIQCLFTESKGGQIAGLDNLIERLERGEFVASAESTCTSSHMSCQP